MSDTYSRTRFGAAAIALLVLMTAAAASGQTIADFFDDQELQEIRLQMNPADWQALKDNYLENTYYEADLEWRGIGIPGIGIRSRGSGSRSPIKPAIGLDFRRYDRSLRFLGLRGLVLRNLSQDASMVHERLAQKLFERMGLPYSRTAHVPLYINDEYVGLYLAVEPTDVRFLQARFGEDSGYLYEVNGGQGYHFEYRGPEGDLYCPDLFEPDTHEDEPECEWLAEWIRVVNESSDAEFAEAVEEFTDIGAILTHLAIDQFTGDWDTPLADDGMTNLRFYRRSDNGRWVWITWDKDMSFATPDHSIWWNTERNVLVRRVLEQPHWRQRYLEALWQVSEVAGDGSGWIAEEARRAAEQIRQAVEDDPNRICAGEAGFEPCPFERFVAQSEYLLNTVIPERYRLVREEVLAAGFDPGEAAYPLMPGDVINLGSGTAPVSPRSLAAIRLEGVVTGESQASAFPLPLELDDVRVTVGGVEAPLIQTRPEEIVFQVPAGLAPGPAAVHVTRGEAASSTVYVDARPASPALFAITHAEGSEVDAESPARAGELLVAWGTGFGSAGGIAAGDPAPVDRLVDLDYEVSGLLGAQQVQVVWAGLAPNLAGMEVVLFEVPAELPDTGDTRLVFLVNGEPGTPWELPLE